MEVDQDKEIKLQTAKGIAKVAQQLPVQLNKLADKNPSALMLDNCPPVLSMGKFEMEEGYFYLRFLTEAMSDANMCSMYFRRGAY